MKYRNVDYSTWSQGRNSGRTHYPTISQEEVLKIGRKACEANKAIRNDEYIRNGALLILNNLVKKHGVRFHDLKAPTVVSWPLASTETLEFLLAHGWKINSCRDINTRDPFPGASLPTRLSLSGVLTTAHALKSLVNERHHFYL
jgi:hypothetical protein